MIHKIREGVLLADKGGSQGADHEPGSFGPAVFGYGKFR